MIVSLACQGVTRQVGVQDVDHMLTGFSWRAPILSCIKSTIAILRSPTELKVKECTLAGQLHILSIYDISVSRLEL